MLRRPVEGATRVIAAAAREQTTLAVANTLPGLLRHPVWQQDDPDQGDGRGVLLVPGFGLSDRSFAPARSWLRARGYRPASAGLGMNVDCTTTMRKRIERRLAEHADATGGRIILIGQSRGGCLGRLVAVRRPDLVRGLVMLGSPVRNPLGVNGHVVRLARLLAQLSTVGVPGLLDGDCLAGTCYRDNRHSLLAPLPEQVPAVAVYSRNDAVAPWRLCRDSNAECVEVRSSHAAMGLDPEVYAAIEPKLAEWASDYAPSDEISVFSSTA